jgi:predicted enzyme related to lactoylglutathione lyase
MLLLHRKQRQGVDTMPTLQNPSIVSWFEVPATDLERARTFYESVLGLTLKYEATETADAMYIFPVERHPERPAVTGALIHRPSQQNQRQSSVVYLDCSGKLQQVLARVPSAGGAIILPSSPVPGGFGYFACIRDTEGNMIGLHSV